MIYIRMRLSKKASPDFSENADCPEYDCCAALREFFGHSGYKYSRYRQTLEFIRGNGHEAFMKAVEDWNVEFQWND